MAVIQFANNRSTSTIINSSSSTTHARARAREADPEVYAMLEDAYLETFDRTLPRAVWDEMEWFMEIGHIQPAVILRALDETCSAPRPSWAYTRAILKHCRRDGALDIEGWEKRQDEHFSRHHRDPLGELL